MATNKRYHCSTDSVDLRSVPPTKISAIPTPRLQSVDKMSSLSAGDSASSSKPICSTSLCLAVPSATGEAVDCEDTPLVDDAMPCHLHRQMFQDFTLSSGQTQAIVHIIPCDRSGS